MTVVSATNKTGLPLDVGVYPRVKILSTAPAEPTGNAKFDKGVPREEIKLRVVLDDGEVIECSDFINMYGVMGKRTKGYNLWSAAVYGGKEIPEGDDLDTDDLAGKAVQVVVKVKTDGTGNFIDSYMAPPAKAAKKRAPVIDDEDDDLADA